MSKFYVGQKVTPIVDKPEYAGIRLGQSVKVTKVLCDVKGLENYELDGIWHVYGKFLTSVNEPPETPTINGVEYIRNPGPMVEHERKFGDVAVHEEYGVGIVTQNIDESGEVEFHYGSGEYSCFLKPSTLTFIRRADLSV